MVRSPTAPAPRVGRNLSLNALVQCIAHLAQRRAAPFERSALTALLRPCLAGKPRLLACLAADAPAAASLATLRFAAAAKLAPVKAKVLCFVFGCFCFCFWFVLKSRVGGWVRGIAMA